MGVMKIPAYAFFGTERISMTYSLLCDQVLFDKFKGMQGQTPSVLYEVSGVSANRPIKIVNEWFGTQILDGELTYYVGLKGDEPGDYYNFLDALEVVGIKPVLISPANHSLTIDDCYSINGSVIHNAVLRGVTQSAGLTTKLETNFGMWSRNYGEVNSGAYLFPDRFEISLYFPILPENIFKDGRLDLDLINYLSTHDNFPEISVVMRLDTQMDCNYIQIAGIYQSPAVTLKNALIDFLTDGAGIEFVDTNNPYGFDNTSTTGGGDGTLGYGGLDSIDAASIPALPSISASNLGFITMYNPSAAQLQALASFLWSNAFDLNTYKKLFSDPMQSIIGLAIVPVVPSIGGVKNVTFGTIDSGISMSFLSTNYVQLDCGSVALEKYVGCFMDNDPYTKISIYLPFIGFRQLSADDLIGGSIHVVYNIDVLTGSCACFIEHNVRGVLYSYNGSCITNVPLTAANFSGAIQNAVSTIGSAIGLMAGMSTGAAPLTAMSAVGLMTSAANTALNSKPQIQRSGNLGGSAGIMSILKPYVVIERPDISVPYNVEKYAGQTSNIYSSLGTCTGFTMCEYVHLDGISATSEELMEIESLLKVGVIL